MLPFHLSQTEVDSVNIERKNHSNALIRDRMQVLYLLNLGYSRCECSIIVGCHRNTVTTYLKMYLEGGLERVRQLNFSFPRHELETVFDQVEQVLEQSDCSTVNDAREILKTCFAYNRSNEAVRQLLHQLGFKRRKTGTFPGKIDNFEQWQAKQDNFIEKLCDLMQKAENEELDLVFGDAAHFVYGKFSNYAWGKTVRYAPSGHGRYRINVYGVYDVVTNQVYSMYNEGYIDAEFMVEYLEWIRQNIYQNQDRPLHIVLDNARYQHCNYVKECAAGLNIILEFLPGYSPNLNLIERLWKYMKQILGKSYHICKETFENAIVDLLENLNQSVHQEKLWTLLNPLFQRFEKAQILPW